MGLSLDKDGQYTEAAKRYDLAIRFRPSFAQAHLMLAADYLHLENYHGAELYFKSALKFQPDYSEANYGLAVTYLLTDRIELAQERYEVLKLKDSEAAEKLNTIIQQFL